MFKKNINNNNTWMQVFIKTPTLPYWKKENTAIVILGKTVLSFSCHSFCFDSWGKHLKNELETLDVFSVRALKLFDFIIRLVPYYLLTIIGLQITCTQLHVLID